jgi:hypothetical protein
MRRQMGGPGECGGVPCGVVGPFGVNVLAAGAMGGMMMGMMGGMMGGPMGGTWGLVFACALSGH